MLPNPIRFALTRVGTSNGQVAILINGVVRPGIRLEFRYQNGTSETVPLAEQHFLVRLPEARWRPGHRLAEILALEAQAVVLRTPTAWVPVASPGGRSDLSLFTGHQREPATAARVVYADGKAEQLPLVQQLETQRRAGTSGRSPAMHRR